MGVSSPPPTRGDDAELAAHLIDRLLSGIGTDQRDYIQRRFSSTPRMFSMLQLLLRWVGFNLDVTSSAPRGLEVRQFSTSQLSMIFLPLQLYFRSMSKWLMPLLITVRLHLL